MSHLTNISIRVAIAATAALCVLSASASAGSYPLISCEAAPAGQTTGWSFTDSTTVVVGNDLCSSWGGLRAWDQLGGGTFAPDNSSTWWVFTAPAGTTITGWSGSRYLHVYSDSGWRPRMKAGASILEDCNVLVGGDCFKGTAGGSPFSYTGLNASEVRFGADCIATSGGGGTGCDRGATLHRIETFLYSSTVTLSESVAPAATITSPGTGWLRGTISVSSSASDQSGIAQRWLYRDSDVYVDVELAPDAAAGGCGERGTGIAYTAPYPCAGTRGINGPRTRTIDTSSWPDGSHQLYSRVLDAALNSTDSSKVTVKTDNNGPASPALTTPAAGQAPTVTATIPSQGNGSPVVEARISVCDQAGANCSTETTAVSSGQTSISKQLTSSVAEGEHVVKVLLVDEAGNTGSTGQRTVLVDRTGPAISMLEPSGGTGSAGQQVTPLAAISDSYDGTPAVYYELAVDNGGFQPTSGFTYQAGHSYTVRVVATDASGNTTIRTGDPITVPNPPDLGPGPGPGPSLAPAPGPSLDPGPGPAPDPGGQGGTMPPPPPPTPGPWPVLRTVKPVSQKLTINSTGRTATYTARLKPRARIKIRFQYAGRSLTKTLTASSNGRLRYRFKTTRAKIKNARRARLTYTQPGRLPVTGTLTARRPASLR